MNQRTPTPGIQLSSSLRERLKRCGRYHASPKSGNDNTSSTNNFIGSCHGTVRETCISPLSRKRSSTSPLDLTESNKRTQLGNNNTRLNETQINDIKSCNGLDSKQERVTPNKTTESIDTPSLKAISRTPLTSRSRSKQGMMKSNRLTFQKELRAEDKGELNCLSDKKYCQFSRVSTQCAPIPGNTQLGLEPSGSKDKNFEKEICSKSLMNENKTVESKTKSDLLKEIVEKEEKLRKLKMVKTYRTKNDLTELQALIDKWRQVSQQALQDLHTEMLEPKPTLTQLIDHLGIEHDLINYDPDEETFNE